jgi:hypothetical protein
MTRKSLFTALFVLLTVLGAEAQKTKISNYPSQTVAEGNGNIVTCDYNVAAFDEISMILPATVNYTVADDYSCRVTLDENLFEYLDIHSKGGCLRLEMVKTLQQVNLKPTKFVIEISAPTIEDINTVGSGDFYFVTPFEARKLDISTAGSGGVYFNETTTIHRLEVSIAGSGELVCKDFYADLVDLSVAGSGDMIIESGTVKKANVSVAGSGSVETRCQLEAMDYSIAGSGSIKYLGNVKTKGTNVGGRIKRIDKD